MAGTSRIDELRKKFDENPRRYFAPLANEYRKIGDFEQAIFICQEFLPQQPGHMSGHIVYGQALFESGRHDEARSVFETALALDPENLIALRHLGDIARAHGDTETARAWYRRVLESDPRNEEIAGILASLDTDAPHPPAAPAVTGQAGAADAGVGGALAIESAIGAATGGDEAPATPSPDRIVADPHTAAPSEGNFDDIAKLFTSSAAPSAPTAPAPPDEEATKPTEDSLGLIHEGEDVLVTDSTTAEEARAHLDALVEGRDVARPAEPQAADSAPPSFSLPFLEGLTSASPAAEPVPPPAAAPQSVAAPLPTAEPARAASADASSAFVTETMAELYVKQGHREQALEVYRQLVQRNPEDAALAGRLRALESAESRSAAPEPEPIMPVPEVMADAGPTIREFLESIALGRGRSGNSHPPQPPADVPNDPPRGGTRGSVTDSLGALFTSAEQSSAPGAPPPPPRADDFAAPAGGGVPEDAHTMPLPGRPSKPAASELSLDHVFRHATPATGNPSHSFSFDQFFSQQAQQDVAASDAAPSGEQNAGLSDDIQQFNAWLEGLKKT